jgi:hypothetical protein
MLVLPMPFVAFTDRSRHRADPPRSFLGTMKDLAQTWGLQMITVHEEIYP